MEQNLSTRRTMITFHNFRFLPHHKTIDCTSPPSSIIYLENCHENIFIQPPFHGEIHYQNFPIQAGMKSFLKNIFFYFHENLLNPNKTVKKNLKILSSHFQCKIIQNLPISYFNLNETILNEKVKNLEKQTILALNYSTILFFRGNITMINLHNEINQHNCEILSNIFTSKAQYGKDFIFYFGKNLNIPTQITINL
jgi:hypothetical protein